jgi:hypothetical protein
MAVCEGKSRNAHPEMAVVDEEAAPRIPKTIRYQRAPHQKGLNIGVHQERECAPITAANTQPNHG